MTTSRPLSPRVWFGSFDAERTWDDAAGSALPALAPGPGTAALGSADELLHALGDRGDLLLTSREMPEELLEDLRAWHDGPQVVTVPGDPAARVETRLAAGGLTAPGREVAPYAVVAETGRARDALGATGDLPSVEVVRAVSSKLWSSAFCQEHGTEGAGQVVASARELEHVVRAAAGPVVLKTAHGVAGRGSMVLRDERMLAPVARHFRQHGEPAGARLLVQPWYERAADFSAHFDVGETAAPHELRFRGMTNRGLAFASSDTLDEEIEDRLRATEAYTALLGALGDALRAEGYHGPVCVDGLLSTDGRLVPVLDVNTRNSMGRIAHRIDDAARRRRSRLSFVNLPCEGDYRDTYTTLREAVVRAGLWLGDGSHPGVRLLTAATLQAPVGRCYYVVHASSAEEIDETEHALHRVLVGR